MHYPTSLLRALAAITMLSALVACGVDNTGGPMPDGDALEFTALALDAGFGCGSFEDAAHLIASGDDIDAFLEGCADFADDADQRAALEAEVAELVDGEILVAITVVLGGCLGDYAVEGIFVDGDILRPWLL